MTTKKSTFKALVSMLSIPIISLFYPILNNPNRGVYSLVTDLDHAIPFLKIFIIPYLAWYFFIFGVLLVLCFKNRTLFYKVLIAYNLGLLICYLFYYFFQTTVPRPEISGNDFLTQLVQFTYQKDAPYNCFPSIHVFTSFLMYMAIDFAPLARPWRWTVKAMSILIILSTLFVKQHVLLDVFSSMFLAYFLFKFTLNLNEEVWVLLKKPYSSVSIKNKYEI